jgi:hypothetical protein
VAEQAFGRDGASEVRPGIVLVSGREIPGLAVGVVANWRLVQVALVLVGEAAAHAARADEESQIRPAAGPQELEPWSDGKLPADLAGKLVGRANSSGRIRHRRSRVAFYQIPVAIHARQRCGEKDHQAKSE